MLSAEDRNAAVALGMDVIGYDPFLSVNAAIQLEPAVKVTADINDIYKNSDYITIHVPYTLTQRTLSTKLR